MVEDRGSSAADVNETAAAYFALGKRLITDGSWEKAAAIFEEVLTFWPDNFEVRLHLGEACYEIHRIDDAITHLQRACQLKPEDRRPHELLGHVYLYTQQWDEGINQFEALRAIDEEVALQIFHNIFFAFSYTLFKQLFQKSKLTGPLWEDAVKFTKVKPI